MVRCHHLLPIYCRLKVGHEALNLAMEVRYLPIEPSVCSLMVKPPAVNRKSLGPIPSRYAIRVSYNGSMGVLGTSRKGSIPFSLTIEDKPNWIWSCLLNSEWCKAIEFDSLVFCQRRLV